MKRLRPLHLVDFYKTGHLPQFPDGTNLVYSNLTARASHLKNIPEDMFLGGTIFYGLQYFCKWLLIEVFNENFFQQDRQTVLDEYKRRMDNALGKGAIPVEHISDLHKQQHLPICIKAVKEGTFVPIKVPQLLIYNTHPDQFWLTNYLESMMSTQLWKPIVSATTAWHYRKLLVNAAIQSGGDPGFVDWQAHDFSFRGMSGVHDGMLSGSAHLAAFTGTDTIGAIDLLEDYYEANSDKEMIGGSVPASEHSVMCMGMKESEVNTFRRLLKIYPAGIVSIVSDTWNFWKVMTEYTRILKTEILARPGKVVFRPDSGDPVKIICGDIDAEPESPAYKGAIECLWEVFGGTVNEKGFKVLDSHVGLIYGDSITPARCKAIVEGLIKKGFCTTNVVFGVGSFTYQHVTRDTYGMAVKATYGEVKGQPRAIFKDPATDIGSLKKSARGLINVYRLENGQLTYEDDQLTFENPAHPSAMDIVFHNSQMKRIQTLQEIRTLLRAA